MPRPFAKKGVSVWNGKLQTDEGKGNGIDNVSRTACWTARPQPYRRTGQRSCHRPFPAMRGNEPFPAKVAEVSAKTCASIVPWGPIGPENVRKRALCAFNVHAQQGVIAFRVKRILGGDDLSTEDPVQAACIQIATHKGLFAKVGHQRPHKSFICTAIRGAAIRKPFAFMQFRRQALFDRAPDGELKICAGKAARKSAMLFHHAAP